MRLASEQALERVLRSWEGVVANRPSDAIGWAGEIFAAGRVLDTSSALLRSITDPSRLPQARADLVHHVFDGKVSAEIVELLAGLARERFSVAEDYPGGRRHGIRCRDSPHVGAVPEPPRHGRGRALPGNRCSQGGTRTASGPGGLHVRARTPSRTRHADLRRLGSRNRCTREVRGFSQRSSVVPQLQHWVGSAGRRSQHVSSRL